MNLEENHKKSSKNQSNNNWFFISGEQWFLNKETQDTLEGCGSWFDSVMKVSKKPSPKKKRIDINKITFVHTKDKDLLKQYYDLRERQYRKKLGFEKYDGQENKYDKTGDIVVALYEEKVIAGGRIDYSNKNKIMCNDDSISGFTYQSLLKEFDSDTKEKDVFSEICGLAVSEKMGIEFFIKFFMNLISHAIDSGSRYVVGIAYPELNKVYDDIFTRFGYGFKIFNDIKLTPKNSYGGNKLDLKFYPIVVKGFN
ncbi:MAG: hypothetical protein ACJAS6_000864 [Rickettsiales bacterium]|jgi:hypothetical protein